MGTHTPFASNRNETCQMSLLSCRSARRQDGRHDLADGLQLAAPIHGALLAVGPYGLLVLPGALAAQVMDVADLELVERHGVAGNGAVGQVILVRPALSVECVYEGVPRWAGRGESAQQDKEWEEGSHRDGFVFDFEILCGVMNEQGRSLRKIRIPRIAGTRNKHGWGNEVLFRMRKIFNLCPRTKTEIYILTGAVILLKTQ